MKLVMSHSCGVMSTSKTTSVLPIWSEVACSPSRRSQRVIVNRCDSLIRGKSPRDSLERSYDGQSSVEESMADTGQVPQHQDPTIFSVKAKPLK